MAETQIASGLTAEGAPHDAVCSFRDPVGYVVRLGGRILRVVRDPTDLARFLQTKTAVTAMETGKLVRSARISAGELPGFDAEYVVEHEAIPFPSYPYEWPPEMLHAAGALTIQLARESLDEGFGLKDATPYNVLFRGSNPFFVDVLSFEQRDAGDASWMAYGQFVRTFLLPLLASRKFGLPTHRSLAGQRDGLEPEMVYRWASPFDRLSASFLKLVSLPKWLGGVHVDYRPKIESEEKARFIAAGLLKSCERQLNALRPKAGDSTWTGYLDQKSLYSSEQLARKEAFVSEALASIGPRMVLDVGCNEGHFSCLAAKHGSSVVAIDSDPVVVGLAWRRAADQQMDILPLVVDITRPTPAVGWRNQECASFLERARGKFDLVMMLAVAHHILVTERVPLEELFGLVEEITQEHVLIEFVGAEDPMFQRIVRGRQALYSHMTKDWFEAVALRHFEMIRSMKIDGLHRWLYLFRKRRETN